MSAEHLIPAAGRQDVVAWRERRLRAAGFDVPDAGLLAGHCGYDLHELISLVEAGCPHGLAMRIAAPIEDPHPC